MSSSVVTSWDSTRKDKSVVTDFLTKVQEKVILIDSYKNVGKSL